MTVSVVIPAFNAGTFIEEAIQSVLSQNFNLDEIIVVNDGSKDFDYDSLHRLSERVVVIQQSNRGVSAARNVGFERARSTYVAILDADDVWLPQKLSLQMRHLALHPECGAVLCRGLSWNKGPFGWRRPDVAPIHPGITHDFLRLRYSDALCGASGAPSTLVVTKTAWEQVGGFDETLRYGEDHDFYLRLCHKFPVDIQTFIGMLYRRHPSSATAEIQGPNHLADCFQRIIDRYGIADADIRLLHEHLARLHFSHGYVHFWGGKLSLARHEFTAAWRLSPTTWRLVYLMLSGVPGIKMLRGLRHHNKLDQQQENTPATIGSAEL